MKKKFRNGSSKKYYFHGFERKVLQNELMPEPLTEFLHSLFSSRREQELAFLACKRLFGNITNEHALPVSKFVDIGFSRSTYTRVIERLLESGLVRRTKKHSRLWKLLARYIINIPFLMELLEGSKANLRGLRGARTKRTFRIKTPGLKEAVKKISLYWNQANAIEYCKTLPYNEKVVCFNTMRYMFDGPMKPSWKETHCTLYAKCPPLNLKRELWRTNIVGGGKPLYKIDWKAYYPNLTAVCFNQKPCPNDDPYEELMKLLKKIGVHLNRSKTKQLFNALLNGNKPKEYDAETLEEIKKAVLESMGISNVEFKAVAKVQEGIRKLGGTIMNHALINAVNQGITELLPQVDCFYTTHNPRVIMKLMLEACREAIGCELPINIEKKPIFIPKTKSDETSTQTTNTDMSEVFIGD